MNYDEILRDVQKELIKTHSEYLDDEKSIDEVKSYIFRYIKEHGLENEKDKLSKFLICELCGYGVIDEYFASCDIEEININSWEDVAITYKDGKILKGPKFRSRENAVDIIKRLLRASHMTIDNSSPISYGNIGKNIRITAIKSPVVNDDDAIAASIRFISESKCDINKLIDSEMLDKRMADFLIMCIEHGVSIVICGRTSSGNTTLLNAIVNEIGNDKRIFTIESGSREINLTKRDDNGEIINNVVSTLTRPSDNKDKDISQEDLVKASLRFDPDLVCIGEMRDVEAYAAIEASLTDHTVITTVHGGGGKMAHERIALLSLKRFDVDMDVLLKIASKAFPVTVFCHRMSDGKRRVIEICECVEEYGKLVYTPLFEYDNKTGKYVMKRIPSSKLCRRFEVNGMNLSDWEMGKDNGN
ncbi:MAG: CpaF/VirB11 family protein [Clostridia bacterium]|nr:CpaF/VirB11 family protein [Clostridia bacterium]